MRISSAAALLILSACNDQPAVEATVESVQVAENIQCAMQGATRFAADCHIEKSSGDAVILRHRSGGFRRMLSGSDGSVVTADGAEAASVMLLPDGRIDVEVGGDRYRLPAPL